jgi:hypothetical protein
MAWAELTLLRLLLNICFVLLSIQSVDVVEEVRYFITFILSDLFLKILPLKHVLCLMLGISYSCYKEAPV